MKRINNLRMSDISGGNFVGAFCATIGLGGGSVGALARFAGSTIAKSLIAGPFGTITGVIGVGCAVYAIVRIARN